jgi:hypothetical protein
MVKSTSLPNGTVVIKPRKRSMGGAGFLLLLMLIVFGALGLGGVALFAPTRLSMAQEQVLGVVHGGIASAEERTYVDGCVATGGTDELFAVARTRRTVIFADGTMLEVVFSGQPQPTNACP